MKTEEEIRARLNDVLEEIEDVCNQSFCDDYDLNLLTELYAQRDILRWTLK